MEYEAGKKELPRVAPELAQNPPKKEDWAQKRLWLREDVAQSLRE